MTTAPTPSRATRIFAMNSSALMRRKRGVEGKNDEARESEPGANRGFVARRRQPEHDRPPGEDVGGMRFEGQERGRGRSLAGHGDGAFDDGLMAEMQAVEIADRVDGAFEPVRRQHRVRGEHEAAGHSVLPMIEISAEP